MKKLHPGRVELYCDNPDCGKYFTKQKSELTNNNYCSFACAQANRARHSLAYKSGYVKVYYDKVKVFEYSFTNRGGLKTMLNKIQTDYPGSCALVTFNDEDGRK